MSKLLESSFNGSGVVICRNVVLQHSVGRHALYEQLLIRRFGCRLILPFMRPCVVVHLKHAKVYIDGSAAIFEEPDDDHIGRNM
jgi:hypothetical protein